MTIWDHPWWGRPSTAPPGRGLVTSNDQTVETIPWHRTDGSVIHVTAAGLPDDGYGIWQYRRRSGQQELFTFALTTGPGGFVRAFIVALDDTILAALGQSFFDDRRDRFDRIPLALSPAPLSVSEAIPRVIEWCESIAGPDNVGSAS